MSIEFLHQLSVRTSVIALGLALSQGLATSAVSAEEQSATQAAPPPAQAAEAPVKAQPVEDRAQTARAAMESRRAEFEALINARQEAIRAEHEARINERQEAMRERAAAHGMELPEIPAPSKPIGWLSYEEMQARMKRQGVEMAPLPALPSELEQPPVLPIAPPPAMDIMRANDQKSLFEVLEAMTPEQQEACFAFSSLYGPARMRPPVRSPMQGRPMMPQRGFAPGYAPGFVPGPGGDGLAPMMMPRR